MQRGRVEADAVVCNAAPFAQPELLALYAILIAAFALRLSAFWTAYDHPDEIIATGVVQGMLTKGTIDTNWRIHEVSRFKFDMYNFSSYYLFLSTIFAPSYWITGEIPTLSAIRAVSMVASSGLILATFLFARVLAGPVAAVVAALLTATSPQLYQDSLYARPESWFALLFLVSLAISISPSRLPLLSVAVASALMGVLLACKISSAPFVPLPLAIYALKQKTQWRTLAGATIVSAAAVLTGALVGALYAFVHPDVFWHGVQVLEWHYSGGRSAPTGLREGTTRERLVYLSQFILATIGIPTLMLSGYGLIELFKHREVPALLIAGGALASIAYLGSRNLFNERNFSHVLPIVFLLAGIGTAKLTDKIISVPTRRLLLACVTIVAPATQANWLYIMRFDVLSGRYAQHVEALRLNVQRRHPGLALITWPNLVYGEPYPPLKAYLDKQRFPFLIDFIHYDDIYGERTLRQFKADYRTTLIATLDSPFKAIVPSTMQAYLAASRLFYIVESPNADLQK